MAHFVQFNDVTKTYRMGETSVDALSGMSFEIDEGELVVILGPSGAGKTTLLNLLGGMDTLTSGEITVAGVSLSKLNSRQLTLFRRHDVGFVFQFYNLMPNLTARENIELATEICKRAAARFHSARGCQKSQNSFVRRAYRRAGLRHGKAGA
jgi:putative ABC transport system ATP-binding protein